MKVKSGQVYKSGWSKKGYNEAVLVLDQKTEDDLGIRIDYSIYPDADSINTSFILSKESVRISKDGAPPTFENETPDNIWREDMTAEELTELGAMTSTGHDKAEVVEGFIGTGWDDGGSYVYVKDINLGSKSVPDRIRGWFNKQPLKDNGFNAKGTNIGEIFEFVTSWD